jgi:hypothetical protein
MSEYLYGHTGSEEDFEDEMQSLRHQNAILEKTNASNIKQIELQNEKINLLQQQVAMLTAELESIKSNSATIDIKK